MTDSFDYGDLRHARDIMRVYNKSGTLEVTWTVKALVEKIERLEARNVRLFRAYLSAQGIPENLIDAEVKKQADSVSLRESLRPGGES